MKMKLCNVFIVIFIFLPLISCKGNGNKNIALEDSKKEVNAVTVEADTIIQLHDLKNDEQFSLSIYQDLPKDKAYLTLTDRNKKELDKIAINNVRGIKEVDLLDASFLSLEFNVRGGSGVKIRRKVIVSVSGKKLYSSLDIESTSNSYLNEVFDRKADSLKLFDEKSEYAVKVNLEKKDKDFLLSVTESKFVYSKYNPSENEDWKDYFQLKYDRDKNIFYNSKTSISGTYKIYDMSSNSERDVTFNNKELSIVKLKLGEYLFIDGHWYTVGRDNYLLLI
jgi:hypothetical protein